MADSANFLSELIRSLFGWLVSGKQRRLHLFNVVHISPHVGNGEPGFYYFDVFDMK